MLNVHPASTRQHLLKEKKSLYDSLLKTIFAVNMLKLKIMKRTGSLLFIASIFCILFANCSDDKEIPENYVFSHIDFVEEEGDGTRQFEEELPPDFFENNTESTVTSVKTIAPKIRVTWESSDPQAFSITNCDSLPIYYLGDTIYYTKGYSEYPGTFCIKESMTVPPYHQLVDKTTVYYEETRSTYLLTLKDEFSDKEKQVKGKFTYTKALYSKSYTHIDPLPQKSE